jgi:cellulose synthase (UDP-forming)
MAFHLILPTLLSLISPRLGKFNVTDKGDLTDRDYFDAYTVRPLIITVLLMVGSMMWVGVRYYMNGYAGIDPRVILFNIAWGCFSTIILLASIAVAKESKQIRKTIRIYASLPTKVLFLTAHTCSPAPLISPWAVRAWRYRKGRPPLQSSGSD